MYPLYFYICLIASVATLLTLILIAIFPINFTIVPKAPKTSHKVQQHKARSPTPRHRQAISYWDALNDDSDDL